MPLLSIIILSYNRREAVLRTLVELEQSLCRGVAASLCPQLILVDNASSDDTLIDVRERFAHLLANHTLHILALPENLAIEGFSRGAALATGEFLLILDDDAWPDPQSLRSALELMQREPTLAGVALLPIHPRTDRPEWRFGTPGTLLRGFPAFGCANLVRASAWRAVGGYQREFATRNWVWLAKRHARGGRGVASILLQFAWTLREAGLDVDRLNAACDGLRDGLSIAPPPVPTSARPTDGLWRLVRMLIAGKRTR
jgi:glycosyltransferase involved in cell wall biosynthesis